MLPDRISQAIAATIRETGINVTVQGSVEPTQNATTFARIVSQVTACTQRAFILKGVYDVIGEVTLIQSIDQDDAEILFRDNCANLREILSDEYLITVSISGNDSNLFIYPRSWQITDMQQDAGERGFKATISWKALIRDTFNT